MKDEPFGKRLIFLEKKSFDSSDVVVMVASLAAVALLLILIFTNVIN